MQRYPGCVHLHRMGNGNRRNSHHPRRQWRPLQGSAGKPLIVPNDDGVGRIGRCPTTTADNSSYPISGAEYENNSDRKEFQKTEALWTYNHSVIVHHTAFRFRNIVHFHATCYQHMEHNRTMLDSIYRHPNRHLVVSRIKRENRWSFGSFELFSIVILFFYAILHRL